MRAAYANRLEQELVRAAQHEGGARVVPSGVAEKISLFVSATTHINNRESLLRDPIKAFVTAAVNADEKKAGQKQFMTDMFSCVQGMCGAARDMGGKLTRQTHRRVLQPGRRGARLSPMLLQRTVALIQMANYARKHLTRA